MQRRAGPLFILASAVLSLAALGTGSARSPRTLPPVQAASEQNLAVIVNLSNPVENFSMADLRKIFLGERTHWPSGRRITLVMMEPGQPERAVVLRDICQMNETDFNNHFLHGLFTGDVLVSPKTLASPVGVRKFVFNVPGAIGYLRATDVDASIKVVRVDERAPEDKGYKLHVLPRQAK